MKDPYYSRSEVSNSDLSNLKKLLYGGPDIDPTAAYKFGSLIDMMITEPERVDYFQYTCAGEQYEKEDFEKASEMRKAFMRDEMAAGMLKHSDTQKVMIEQDQLFDYSYPFHLPVRCKWDLWMEAFGWGGDIKSTTATTQKQFEEAVRYFDYDRQRFFYMNIAGSKQDILIGISKVNFKIFKVPIRRGDELWQSGRRKTMELAFKYWLMFAA